MSASRNFDVVTLRGFLAIVEMGSMTAASKKLHVTQSALSMQIKRLEDSLGISVFERVARGLTLTKTGERLLHYARQMVVLNDEAWGRLTAPDYEGEVSLGVPVDLIDPLVPQVLRAFNREYPRSRVRLRCHNTNTLLKRFDADELDIVLTTQRGAGQGGEVLRMEKLCWTGAKDGEAWRQRPLPLAFSSNCVFRADAISALDESGIDWVDTTDTDDEIAIYASIDADLAIGADLQHAELRGREIVTHQTELPELPEYAVVLYTRPDNQGGLVEALSSSLRAVFN